jgi:hypothetical protein
MKNFMDGAGAYVGFLIITSGLIAITKLVGLLFK